MDVQKIRRDTNQLSYKAFENLAIYLAMYLVKQVTKPWMSKKYQEMSTS